MPYRSIIILIIIIIIITIYYYLSLSLLLHYYLSQWFYLLAQTNTPWWSYEVGLIHFVGISTEHNYTIGSDQWLWLEKDLKSVNREVTPWIIFGGHRAMYLNSNYGGKGYNENIHLLYNDNISSLFIYLLYIYIYIYIYYIYQIEFTTFS